MRAYVHEFSPRRLNVPACSRVLSVNDDVNHTVHDVVVCCDCDTRVLLWREYCIIFTIRVQRVSFCIFFYILLRQLSDCNCASC